MASFVAQYDALHGPTSGTALVKFGRALPTASWHQHVYAETSPATNHHTSI